MKLLQGHLQNVRFDSALTDFTRFVVFGYLIGTEIQSTDWAWMQSDEQMVSMY